VDKVLSAFCQAQKLPGCGIQTAQNMRQLAIDIIFYPLATGKQRASSGDQEGTDQAAM